MNAGVLLAASGLPRSEARALLAWVLNVPRERLIAHPEQAVTAALAARFHSLVAQRSAGTPLAYLLGRQEFRSRPFQVDPNVLIPRPETELLVELAQAACRGIAAPRLLDLGTGSGCIAITLALELDCTVTAVDISTEALALARGNAARLRARVEFLQSDWFAKVEGAFDFIVGNPPYIAAGDPHLAQGDLRFEPATALASGNDGLTAIRHILSDARRHLASGGWLFLEHGYDQAEAMAQLLAEAGFRAVEQHRDLAGIIRVSGGA
jgi:release factor glutamine methyltransferase